MTEGLQGAVSSRDVAVFWVEGQTKKLSQNRSCHQRRYHKSAQLNCNIAK